MVRRMLLTGMSSYSAGAAGAALPGVAVAPEVGVVAAEEDPGLYFSTSSCWSAIWLRAMVRMKCDAGCAKSQGTLTLTIRPSGPVPLISPKGIPRSRAIFLARGLAKNRGLSDPAPTSGAFWAEDPPPLPYLVSS